MSDVSQSTLSEALRRTRAGDLTGATELIRSMLGGSIGTAAATPVAAQAAVEHKARPATVHHTPLRPTSTAGRFAEHRYIGAQGVLSYRLYIPADAEPGAPLVVMLHGCTQDPDDFARGTAMNAQADAHGFLVAYPCQTQSANAQKCWNWFRPEDQRRDHGEPALIAGLTRAIIAEHGIDANRVYVAGLSAGGAAAAVMAAAYPDLYAAVGIHSGLACGVARDVPSALMAMRRGGGAGGRSESFVPIITFHGDQDQTVHEVNAREIIAAASTAQGTRLTTKRHSGRSEGGRAYIRETSADASGTVLIEQWTVQGLGHAWSGGDSSGSYTDPSGPDASAEMVRFFLEHRHG